MVHVIECRDARYSGGVPDDLENHVPDYLYCNKIFNKEEPENAELPFAKSKEMAANKAYTTMHQKSQRSNGHMNKQDRSRHTEGLACCLLKSIIYYNRPILPLKGQDRQLKM